MPKILFIQPTQYAEDGNLCKQNKINLPSLSFPLLAAYTPDNWEIELNIEVVDEINYESDADIVAISSMGISTLRGFEIGERFKKKGKIVVMGGYMVSIASDVAKKYADTIVVGDAEISYPLMLKDFEETGTLKAIYDNPIDNLDNLPIPKYELLMQKKIGNMLPVQAGRGCSYNCSFCSIACLYKGKYMFRPVNDVIRDIKEVKRLGFNRFYLIDDNIISNPKYLTELCEKITPLKMKWASQCTLSLAKNPKLLDVVVKSGCNLMSFGVESILQKSIDSLNKPWLKASDHDNSIKVLYKAGITVSTEMIIGTDYDTVKSIENTADFVNHNKIAIPRFYILTPVPGTKLYSDMKKENRLISEDFKRFDGTECMHVPKKMTPNEVTEMYWWLNNEIFSFKSIFNRTLFNKRLWKNIPMLLFSIVINLHYRMYVKKKVSPNIF